MPDVDVVVVGLGPGGEYAAGLLADAGLDVVGVEARLVGGECPYWACVPTKMMVRASDALAQARYVRELAGSAKVQPDWAPVAARIRRDATDDWNDAVAVRRLEGQGVRVVHGRGRITAPGEVTVTSGEQAGQAWRARRGILLNPGTEPALPPVDGLAGTPYWTNREAVAATVVPQSLVVLGGGPVGCEFGQVFARFGVAVTIVEMAKRLLPGDEPEAGALLATVFQREGITVQAGATVKRVTHDSAGFTLHVDGSTLSGAQLLVAAGRRTDLAALGVGAVGIDEGGGGIEVDERMRAADGVWAIGDVTGRGAFTHTSMYQGRIAAADILGQDVDAADYRAMPRVTFTDPEIGAVGLTEAAARAAGFAVRVGVTQLPDSARGWIHKAGNDGFVKLVEDAGRGVLVGATSAGPTGGEVLGALAVAVHAEVPTTALLRMIYAYPTFHRAIEDALANLR